MPTITQQRAMLSWAYLGERWLTKVIHMSDAQVHTVYSRMMNHGQLKGIHENVKIRKSDADAESSQPDSAEAFPDNSYGDWCGRSDCGWCDVVSSDAQTLPHP